MRSTVLLCGLSAIALGAGLSAPAFAQARLQPTPSDHPAPIEGPRAGGGSGTNANTGGSPQASNTIAEVVVTASKRQDVLINVPVAASALTASQLQQYSSNDLSSIASQLPQVQLQTTGGGSSGASFAIRGVGNLAVDYGNEQPVALVIDGVQLTRGRAIDLGAFDIQQVEVLEGPQALYFGKNSPAGVVALTSVSPGQRFEGYARVGYDAQSETPFGEFAVSVPVTDTFAVRAALRYANMLGGTVDNLARPIADPFPNETGFTLPGASASSRPLSKDIIGRFTAVWRPNSAFDANFKFSASDYRDNGESLLNGVAACAPGNAHPTSTDLLAPAFAFQDPYGPCQAKGQISNGNAPPQITSHFLGGPAGGQPFSHDVSYLTSLTMNYRLSDITLTSVTGFYYADSSGYDNYDLTVYAQALDAQAEINRTFTQELRATSSFSGPLNFSAGAYYEHDNRVLHNTDKIFPLGPYPGPGAYNGMYNTLALRANNYADSYSAFAQIRWKIIPTLELAGGARYSHDQKSTVAENTFNYLDLLFTGPLAAFNPFAPGGRVFDAKVKENDVSPEFTLTWRPRNGLTFYGAYKEGYLAGGSSNPGNLSNYDVLCSADPHCTNPADLLNYKAEKAKGEEIGAKGVFLGGRLYADMAVYRYEYTNLQVTSFDAATTSFFTTNAASALDQGFEAKARFNVNPNLQLHGFIAYTDLHFEQYPGAQCYSGQTVAGGCVGGVQDLGNTPYGGPPWDFNVGATYHHALANGWGMGLAGDLYCHTKTPRPNADPFAPGGDAYCTADASLRLYQEPGPLEFAVIATNLSNSRETLPASTAKPLGAPGDLSGLIIPARQLILQATYRF